MLRSPEPGDEFSVSAQRELRTVAHLIAAFTSETKGESVYLVQSPAGARWLLAENSSSDGPKWIGRAVPADTSGMP